MSKLDLAKIVNKTIKFTIPARIINPYPINNNSPLDVKKYNPKIRVPIINEIKAVHFPNVICFSAVIFSKLGANVSALGEGGDSYH